MKTQWTLLLIGGLSALAPARIEAQAIDLRPMVVTDLTGNLDVFLPLPFPCEDVTMTTPVLQGRIEIAPGEDAIEVGGQRLFMLTRASFSFGPFPPIYRSCWGHDVSRIYTAINVQLGGAASFLASAGSPNVYPVTIPKEKVLLREASVVNGEAVNGTTYPQEDVTGTIDLAHGTVQLVVKAPLMIHDDPEVWVGTLTAALAGRIVFPDTDGDGVPNGKDNCRLLANPTQGPVASPVIRAPGEINLSSCIYRGLGLPIAADICDGGDLTITNDAPPKLPAGTTVVTWKAEDSHGRYAKSQQNVTVIDTTPPAVLSVPPNVSLNNCVAASLGIPSGVDDCDVSLTFTNNAPTKFPAGSTAVTWTATDDSGNHATSSATQTVTVNDTVRPTAVCAAVVNFPGRFRASSTDACTASPTIRLGSYVLGNPETIELVSSATAGVSFLGFTGPRLNIRQFAVGATNNVVTATDASGNIRNATCLFLRP